MRSLPSAHFPGFSSCVSGEAGHTQYMDAVIGTTSVPFVLHLLGSAGMKAGLLRHEYARTMRTGFSIIPHLEHLPACSSSTAASFTIGQIYTIGGSSSGGDFEQPASALASPARSATRK